MVPTYRIVTTDHGPFPFNLDDQHARSLLVAFAAYIVGLVPVYTRTINQVEMIFTYRNPCPGILPLDPVGEAARMHGINDLGVDNDPPTARRGESIRSGLKVLPMNRCHFIKEFLG